MAFTSISVCVIVAKTHRWFEYVCDLFLCRAHCFRITGLKWCTNNLTIIVVIHFFLVFFCRSSFFCIVLFSGKADLRIFCHLWFEQFVSSLNCKQFSKINTHRKIKFTSHPLTYVSSSSSIKRNKNYLLNFMNMSLKANFLFAKSLENCLFGSLSIETKNGVNNDDYFNADL